MPARLKLIYSAPNNCIKDAMGYDIIADFREILERVKRLETRVVSDAPLCTAVRRAHELISAQLNTDVKKYGTA